MRCDSHNWTARSLPCPWLRCANGSKLHHIEVGKKKKRFYVRARNKTELGPVYTWEKVDQPPEAAKPTLPGLSGLDQSQELVW